MEREFAILAKKVKIAEDVECVDRHNRDRKRGKNKRDLEPSSSVMRPKKKARSDGPVKARASVAPTGIQLCRDCGRRHPGECWRKIGACLRCGPLEHRIRKCPQWANQMQASGSGQIEANQPALVYATRHREDRDALEVITDTFVIFDVPYTALIDIGSTHSYVASIVSKNLGVSVESTSSELTILSPLGQSVQVSKLYRDVSLEVQGAVFLADLMELPFEEFDLILGMDWLVKHRVSLDCTTKRVVLKIEDDRSVSISGDSSVCDIKTMRDFLDVIPEKLPGLPLNQKVEFNIELLPGTALVSTAPYRRALNELTELKAQL
ncbi:hypothetical protein EPI10_023468 [Gossypium australe]|uniref:Gag protease polyprotein-like protein n=1 Tax=Gossypium australe TaxID=47621 RepID=A0A5B6VVI7_9ROSI|nr:hypothetical protein EPI10_023468 [Gossypium australe]